MCKNGRQASYHHTLLVICVAVEEGHTKQNKNHQHKRQRRAEIVIVGLLKLALNYIADKVKGAAAEFLRNIEGTHARHKNHRNARNNAGQAHGHNTFLNNNKPVAAQILRRLDKAVVKLRHNRINGKYHKGQKVINHAQNDRARCVNHVDGLDTYF